MGSGLGLGLGSGLGSGVGLGRRGRPEHVGEAYIYIYVIYIPEHEGEDLLHVLRQRLAGGGLRVGIRVSWVRAWVKDRALTL